LLDSYTLQAVAFELIIPTIRSRIGHILVEIPSSELTDTCGIFFSRLS
jgi:hypothetical protein